MPLANPFRSLAHDSTSERIPPPCSHTPACSASTVVAPRALCASSTSVASRRGSEEHQAPPASNTCTQLTSGAREGMYAAATPRGYMPLEGGGYLVAPPPAENSPSAWTCFNPCNIFFGSAEKGRGNGALPDGFPPAPKGFHRYVNENIDEGLQVERYLGDVRARRDRAPNAQCLGCWVLARVTRGDEEAVVSSRRRVSERPRHRSGRSACAPIS